MKRPTVNDVAAHANVSRATVSLVMRDSPQIPDTTKLRVRAAMAEIGYVYNRRAAELRGSHSRVVGLVVANVRNPYIAELTMAVEDAAAAEGYTVLLGCSSDDVDRQALVLRAMIEHRVDGVLLLPASHTSSAEVTALLGRGAVPHVVVSRGITDYAGTYVGPDNDVAGHLVGQHLAELGARRVLILGGVSDSLPRTTRLNGLEQGLGRGHLSVFADLPSASDSTEEVHELLVPHLAHDLPDVIVTYNDMYALSAMSTLRSVGIEPGRDVAVASFDDIPDAARAFPTLTSAAGFPALVGSTACNLLLKSAQNRSGPPETSLIHPELRVRDSTLGWRGGTSS